MMMMMMISDDGLFNRLSLTRRLIQFCKRVTHSPAVRVRPYKVYETFEHLRYYVHLNGVGPPQYDKVKVFVDHNTVFLQAKTCDTYENTLGISKYICWIDLPDIDSPYKKYNISDIKADLIMNEAILKLTIPKFKQEDLAFQVNVDAVD